MEPKLVFSTDRKSVTILNVTGLCSKSEVLVTLTELCKEEKISKQSFMNLAKEIMDAPNFPEGDIPKEKVPEMLSFALESLFQSLFSMSNPSPNGQIKEAFFEMCSPGSNHGHIYTKEGTLGNPVHSKYFGLKATETLFEGGLINKSERDKLTKEVNESPLPVTLPGETIPE